MTSSKQYETSNNSYSIDENEPTQIMGSSGSLFGRFLWRALSGEADHDGNEEVTLGEIEDFVTQQVIQTQKIYNQTPQVYGFYPIGEFEGWKTASFRWRMQNPSRVAC